MYDIVDDVTRIVVQVIVHVAFVIAMSVMDVCTNSYVRHCTRNVFHLTPRKLLMLVKKHVGTLTEV